MLAALIAEASDQPVWWLVAATFTVAAVGIAAIFSLWVARKTRHAELVVEISRRWNDPLAIEAWVLFKSRGTAATVALIERIYGRGVTKRTSADLRDWQKISIFPDLVEVIAVFVKKRMISRRLVYDMWGANIYEAWVDFEEPLLKLRELSREDRLWGAEAEKILENFQSLAYWMGLYLAAERNGVPTTLWGFYWRQLSNAPAVWWRYIRSAMSLGS